MKEKRLKRAQTTAPPLVPLCGVILLAWTVLALLPATRDVFLSQRNLQNLLVQISPLVVLAVGMTCVILIRGIDLSVGAGVALTGVVAALLQIEFAAPAWVAIAAALSTGIVLGLWQGFWVARFSIPAFVVTLAGFYAFRGTALVVSNSRGLSPMGEDFMVLVEPTSPTLTIFLIAAVTATAGWMTIRRDLRRRALRLPAESTARLVLKLASMVAFAVVFLALFAQRGLPNPVLVAGAVVAAGLVLTERTRLGRYLYAIGGNPEAARVAGVPVERVTAIVYVMAGLCTAIAGIILCARTNGVTPGSTGQLLELDVITAVVIGGTSLMGGRGSVLGSLLGAVLFGTVANGMNLLEINSNWQLILKGLLLLSAVLIDVLSKRRTS